ncbi:MAG: NAD(P)-dependent oxidoreductase [Bacteroidia bacterium]|nr:NAD(P)-dependent oxidoreductase [Bacteroidia bacterium]
MMRRIKIGILRETKTPPDRRVAVPPALAAELTTRFPDVDLIVQPSSVRCFPDEEYLAAGVTMQEDLSECDWLIGVKEVDIPALIEGKKYLFFAHVAKRQAYNQHLLQEIVRKKITLVDYEYLKDEKNLRLIAFGHWAGVVGAFNGILAWGRKTGQYYLTPAHECHDKAEMESQLKNANAVKVRILVTGGGRVALGAMETLGKLGIPIVTPDEYLDDTDRSPVICRIDPWHYAQRKNGEPFDFDHFCKNPWEYESCFSRFSSSTDLFIAAHFWDPASPKLWLPEEMKNDEFRIRMIADISCDINGSVPSTIRATTIADPFYDWDRFNLKELPPFSDPQAVTVMSIDNLPGELPRDASEDFSRVLIDKVFPCLLGDDPCHVIDRAIITRDGHLNEPFLYLESFIKGE